MNQRGSWEAARPCRLSLEATAGISSSHWCLGKRGQQAVGSGWVGTAVRTPPVPTGQPHPLAP